jgi:outer membrane protein OmpA-like peptidoglycan-associated protein
MAEIGSRRRLARKLLVTAAGLFLLFVAAGYHYSFRGATESGESFSWSGRIMSDPPRSSGQLSIEGIRLPKYKPYYETDRPFQVRDGRIDVSGTYDAAWTATEKKLVVTDGRLVLTDAKIARPGGAEPDIEVTKLTVEDADVDALKLSASIGRIALEGGHIVIRHDKDNTVNLYEMIRPFVEPQPTEAPTTAAAGAPPVKPQVKVGELSVTGVSVDAEDLVPERPFKVRADEVSLSMTGIDTAAADSRCPVSLSARFGPEGRVVTKGTFSPDFHAGELDVEVEGVDIQPTDTYVAPVAKVRIASGKVGAKGHVTYEMPPQRNLEFHYAGDLLVRDLAVLDGESATELARLAVLKIAPMDVKLNPMRIDVGEIAVGAPQPTVEVAPDRSINLQKALAVRTDPSAPAPPPMKPEDYPDLAIDAVRLQNGSIRLTDRSIDPAVVTSIRKIDGTIKGISSKELERANVDIKALFEGVAPMAMTGQINPIARKDFTDLTVNVQGVDLLPFSPYAGKYLGWTLAKGKMGADLKYRIAERRFKSENVFTIDQMQLGTKTESPEAVKLPVKLAVAVLRDKNGQIVLDVPAEGSVDDPEFRLGRVIVRAIVNVLTKIVTSPFRLLANAFGSKDENIDFQEFPPGSAELPEPEKAKLDVVAKSLAERPELSVDVMGMADPATDGEALKQARLQGLVTTQKKLWDPTATTVAVEEYAKWLKAAHQAAFPDLPTPESTSEIEAKLLGTIMIGPDDLRELAADRARSVRDYLTGTAGVTAERVFLSDAAPKEGREPACRAWLELK